MAEKILFTQEQLNEMVKMHDSGWLNREIAEYFNTSAMTICRNLSCMGVKSRHPKLNDERKKSAIKLYQKYQRLDRVGKELNMNPKTVKQILVDAGVHVLNSSEVAQKCFINEHYFDVIDSPRKAYYLGLIAADGTIRDGSSFQISLQKRDGYIIEQMRKDFECNYKISTIFYSAKNPNYQNQLSIGITNRTFCNSLVQQGITPNKSLNFVFPDKLPETYYSSFLLGYMDGDGTISKNPQDCRCNLLGTVEFCNTVAGILKNVLDVNTSIMYCHRNTNSPTRTMQIAGRKQVKRFLDWLYSNSDICLERKKKIYLDVYCD